jgi:hypothetical protein
MKIKSLILLLLIPIITFCSGYQSHTLRDSTGSTVTYTQLNVENSIQNDVLINKVDSLIKVYNNDTTYYVIQTFIDKELPLYKDNKIREAKLKLYWPITVILSLFLLIISIIRQKSSTQFFAWVLLIASLIMTGVEMPTISMLFQDSNTISVLNLLFK